MKKYLGIAILLIVVVGCQPAAKKAGNLSQYKDEILQTEKEFEKMAADSGLPAAFSHYVADSGVVNVQDSLFIGPKAVYKFYQRLKHNDMSLKWTPDFVDVSGCGDLGYTYGHFIFSYKDSTGTWRQSKGIFHTVWKRQTDGNWRFVWD
jgi:ketosteroid isomerase-like protein